MAHRYGKLSDGKGDGKHKGYGKHKGFGKHIDDGKNFGGGENSCSGLATKGSMLLAMMDDTMAMQSVLQREMEINRRNATGKQVGDGKNNGAAATEWKAAAT